VCSKLKRKKTRQVNKNSKPVVSIFVRLLPTEALHLDNSKQITVTKFLKFSKYLDKNKHLLLIIKNLIHRINIKLWIFAPM